MPAAAVILFVNPRGEVLLRLRGNSPGLPFPNQWDTIGGEMEFGESHEQTAIRETMEEIGLELRNHIYVRKYQASALLHIYAAPLDQTADQLVLTEGRRVAWLNLDAALALPLVPWVRAVLPEFVASDVAHRLQCGG